uniref:AP20 region protein 1 n=1 Tax=Marmota marmota marmota TaxID=9994 RepID=A0A8C5ZGQ0_MARMA
MKTMAARKRCKLSRTGSDFENVIKRLLCARTFHTRIGGDLTQGIINRGRPANAEQMGLPGSAKCHNAHVQLSLMASQPRDQGRVSCSCHMRDFQHAPWGMKACLLFPLQLNKHGPALDHELTLALSASTSILCGSWISGFHGRDFGAFLVTELLGHPSLTTSSFFLFCNSE